ncbi:MAG: immune inhibitor A [Dehalococcoidia bacterium]|nr:immune inhibitor A [Dehalococcoidia bacterium]
MLTLAVSCGGSNGPAASPGATATASALPSATPPATPAPAAELPARDLVGLAQRFRGLSADPARLAREAPYGYRVGDGQKFSLIDLDTPEALTLTATVRLITDHAYFFVEDGVSYSQQDLERIGGDFEAEVYPRVTAAFGSEWTPGVDSDPRITILHANLRGAGGYFAGSDEFPAAIVPLSNEREMLYVDAGALGAPGADYNTLIAHELQHMVHSHADPDEDSWVNEGLSQVAAEMMGGGKAWLAIFLDAPDTQLTFWPPIGDTTVHYAASELFFSYLLDHYGGRENAAQLLRIQADGIAGVDEYLGGFGRSFRDVFADWAIANYLDLPEGPYSHEGFAARASTSATTDAPGTGAGTVSQSAADYLDVSGPGVFTFDGSDEVSVGIEPVDGPGAACRGRSETCPYSVQAFWWSDRGDGIDTRLTREFDLTGVSRATLRFSAWWDIERGWDYAYVAASADGGKTWQALPGEHTTAYDPVEAAYGRGYTGHSPGWVDEQVDLSAFAGQKVLLRFELVTDDATNLTGFAVDNIQVPELAYRDGAETDGGWQAEGFRRIEGPLRQQFIVQVIDDSGDTPQVRRIELDGDNRARIALTGRATVVVAAVTEDTAEPAAYAWSLAAP